MEDRKANSGIVTQVTQLFALYVVYVFLSGWTFLDYYFREFSVDPRWLDLPPQELLVKGFTVLLTHGWWLWPIYAAMLIVPLIVDARPGLQKRVSARVITSMILFVALFGVYFASRSAAVAEAENDKSVHTHLPVILFSRKPPCPAPRSDAQPTCDYTGNVLAIRNGVFYVHHSTPANGQRQPSLTLSIFRAEDLDNVRLIEH